MTPKTEDNKLCQRNKNFNATLSDFLGGTLNDVFWAKKQKKISHLLLFLPRPAPESSPTGCICICIRMCIYRYICMCICKMFWAKIENLTPAPPPPPPPGSRVTLHWPWPWPWPGLLLITWNKLDGKYQFTKIFFSDKTKTVSWHGLHKHWQPLVPLYWTYDTSKKNFAQT